MASKDAMMARHPPPRSHCGPYCTQTWLMGKAKEKP